LLSFGGLNSLLRPPASSILLCACAATWGQEGAGLGGNANQNVVLAPALTAEISTCFLNRYAHLHGVACIGFDMEGHGRSDGLHVMVESWHRFVAWATDFLDAFVPDKVKEWSHRLGGRNLKTFAVGESMGGAVSAHRVRRLQSRVQLCIACFFCRSIMVEACLTWRLSPTPLPSPTAVTAFLFLGAGPCVPVIAVPVRWCCSRVPYA
jgi:pimeloyl-ACP methyl ester carboxylesterase